MAIVNGYVKLPEGMVGEVGWWSLSFHGFGTDCRLWLRFFLWEKFFFKDRGLVRWNIDLEMGWIVGWIPQFMVME